MRNGREAEAGATNKRRRPVCAGGTGARGGRIRPAIFPPARVQGPRFSCHPAAMQVAARAASGTARFRLKSMGQTSHLQFRFDAFELNEADARLKRDGRPVALPPKAFGVLCELARKPGALVTKNALLDAVWGHQHVSESVLKTTISQVRAALEDDAANPRYIETASRLGYRFIGAANGAGNDASPVATTVTKSMVVPAAAIPDSFVGRRGALDRLQDAWVRAGNGQRQL